MAKDDKGAETNGPVWHFTTAGGVPDLIIASLTTTPAGHIQTGQSVTLTANVQNVGAGSVVDGFSVDFKVVGSSVGAVAIDSVFLAGTNLSVSIVWTYSGGDPSIEITADNLSAVSESNEQNNRLIAILSEVADNTPPTLIACSPTNGAALQQIQQITATLLDSQSAVNDSAVIASFSVVDASQVPVAGSIGEANNCLPSCPRPCLWPMGPIPLA